MNQKKNSAYKPTTRKNKELIRARYREGFILDDFKNVIDLKTVEWLNDPHWSKYLRPETLFGTKFESYLNQKPPKKKWRREDFDLHDEE
ncbi:conserved phage C-terminal domain-containing protein [Peribacillus cavernae]|uniref:conserved phage C-terminal domain-containing protein n=1 Tax=Peribacillus cavernae TaxID=1674310 RepID=UPI001FEB2A8F|nr:conserved phage C-terminal domain-containing protein [Peribacillus cavernae]